MARDGSKEEHFFEIEYQLRMQGKAIGSPVTMCISDSPKTWGRQQCGGAVLLSSKEITREEYLMRTVAAAHSMSMAYE